MAESTRSDAADILRRRYVGDDVQRAAEVERERMNAEVAQLIYDRRVAAGLTQKELARLVGTTQSVISRLEDADYEGHSLTMLQRVAAALGQRITIDMAPAQRRTA
ncbi:MAG TPA: XRE family transcriptional regulator [Longimicrobiaceae bacterium]|nr:XRE family transcriptional regulator [Longimicrobiaceae bacterium]